MTMYNDVSIKANEYEKCDRRHKSHKTKDDNRENRHKHDKTKKSKKHRRSRSRSRDIKNKYETKDSLNSHSNQDDKYHRNRDVDKCNIKKPDYNSISGHKRRHSRSPSSSRKRERLIYYDRDADDQRTSDKQFKYVDKPKIEKHDYSNVSDHKSKNKESRSHKRKRRSNSSDIELKDCDSSSPELNDDELLESLRQKRAIIIAELLMQENKSNVDNQDNNAKEGSTSSFNSFGVLEKDINFDSLSDNHNVVTEDEIEEKFPIIENNEDIQMMQNVDDFDMFGENFSTNAKPKTLNDNIIENHRLNDNWDDSEGYYNIRLGEVMDGRYSVYKMTGKGVFSNVVKARDSMDCDKEVAIKVLRNNEMMYRAGLKELGLLNKINDMDKSDKYHCVRLLRHFMHKNHLCLVFECMDMNLRDVVKKYGRNIGLNITAIRSYAHQLLLALKLIKKADLIHADIKPDNILVNSTKTVLKLSDFGSAINVTEVEPTEELASRFYRAPEVILGLPFDCNVDLWAVGVTLYELYTGHIMFPGRDNNDMLRLMMDAKGRMPNKMIKKSEYCRELYFDEQFNFLQKEVDTITEMEKVRVVRPGQPKTLDFSLFLRSKETFDQDDYQLRQLRDLLDRMLQLDPGKRISINDALSHPFFTDQTRK